MGAPKGIWLGATHALGQPVPDTEPYPHICGCEITGTMTGRRYRARRADCAACGERWQPNRRDPRPHHYQPAGVGCCPLPRGHQVHDVPDIDDDQRENDARRTGER